MNALFTLAIVLYTIVCVLLIFLIIVQGGKAEGLFANSQSNVLGSQSANVLTKATSVLATIFIVGALVISVAISSQRTAFDVVETAAPATTEQTSVPALPLTPAQTITNTDITN